MRGRKEGVREVAPVAWRKPSVRHQKMTCAGKRMNDRVYSIGVDNH